MEINAFQSLKKSFFREKSLIFQAADEPAEGSAEAAAGVTEKPKGYDNACKIAQAIFDVNHDLVLGGHDPTIIFQHNPYAQDLFNFMKDWTDEDLNISHIEFTDDAITLKYSDPAKSKEINGESMMALTWLQTVKDLKTLMPNDIPVSPELLEEAVNKLKLDTITLIGILAFHKDDDIDVNLVNSVTAELRSLIPRVTRARLGTDVVAAAGRREREEVRNTLPRERIEIPETPELADEEFIKSVDFKQKDANFNILDLTGLRIKREKLKLDVSQWDPTSNSGLQRVVDQWKNDLGININDPFYSSLIANLNKGVQKRYSSSNPDMYINPLEHMDELQKNDRTYAAAYNFFEFLKKKINESNMSQQATFDNIKVQDHAKLADGIIDFLGDNVRNLQTAYKKKEWGTVLVYGGGIYALSKLWGVVREKAGDKKNWLIYAAAAYTGYYMAQVAGFDPLVMAGIKDKFDDFEGTPLDLNYLPEVKARNLDPKILAHASQLNAASLYQAYKKAQDSGNYFIEPSGYAPWATMAKFRGKDIDRGAKGLKETPDQKAFSREKEHYIHAGTNLYAIMQMIDDVYKNKVEAKINVPLAGLLEKTNFNEANLRLILEMIKEETPETVDVPASEAQGELQKIFDQYEAYKGMIEVEGIEGVKEKYISAKIKGYPVVFVAQKIKGKKVYKVYYKNQFQDKSRLSTIAEIPAEGSGQEAEVVNAVAAVDRRIKELFDELTGQAYVNNNPVYYKGAWTVQLKIDTSEATNFGLGGEIIKEVNLEIIGEGRAVRMVNKKAGIDTRLGEAFDNREPLKSLLLKKVMDEPKFEPLRVMANEDLLRISQFDNDNRVLVLSAGESGNEVKTLLKYNGTEFEFANGDGYQPFKEFMNSDIFANAYVEAMKKSSVVDEFLKPFKKLIENADEEHLPHLFKQLFQWPPNMKLSDMQGSIPELYTYALADAQKNFILRTLQHKIQRADNINDLKTKVDEAMGSFHKFKEISGDMVEVLINKGSVDFEAFNSKVLDPMTDIGTDSEDYRYWRKDFIKVLHERIGHSDWQSGNVQKINAIIEAFDYWTSDADDPEIDGVNLNNMADPKTLKHFKHAQYCNYIAAELLGKMASREFDNGVSGPRSMGFTFLKDFDAIVMARNPILVSTLPPMKTVDDYKIFENSNDLNDPRYYDSRLLLPQSMGPDGVELNLHTQDNVNKFLNRFGARKLASGLPGIEFYILEHNILTELQEEILDKIKHRIGNVNNLPKSEHGLPNSRKIRAFVNRYSPKYLLQVKTAQPYGIKITLGSANSLEDFSEDSCVESSRSYDSEEGQKLFMLEKNLKSYLETTPGATVNKAKQMKAIDYQIDSIISGFLNDPDYYHRPPSLFENLTN